MRQIPFGFVLLVFELMVSCWLENVFVKFKTIQMFITVLEIWKFEILGYKYTPRLETSWALTANFRKLYIVQFLGKFEMYLSNEHSDWLFTKDVYGVSSKTKHRQLYLCLIISLLELCLLSSVVALFCLWFTLVFFSFDRIYVIPLGPGSSVELGVPVKRRRSFLPVSFWCR